MGNLYLQFAFSRFFSFEIRLIYHTYIICCSVTIARMKRYITVVGTPRTVVQTANRFTGSASTKECAGVSVNSSEGYDKYNNRRQKSVVKEIRVLVFICMYIYIYMYQSVPGKYQSQYLLAILIIRRDSRRRTFFMQYQNKRRSFYVLSFMNRIET